MLKKLPLASVLMALTVTASAADLMDVYEAARASDPQLAIAEANSRASAAGVGVARAAILPQVDASYSKNKNWFEADQLGADPSAPPVATLSTSGGGSSYGASLTQSIYSHANYMRLRAAKSGASKGELDYEAANDQLIVRVAEAYFNVLTAQTNLASAEAQEKAVGRQLEQAEQRFEVGLSAITEVHEARAQFDSARAAVIQAQNGLDDTFEALTELTGASVETVKPLQEDIPLDKPTDGNLEDWVTTALEMSPAVRAQQQQLESARYNAKAAWAGHLPTVGLNAQYSKSSQDGDVRPFQTLDPINRSVGVSLNVPIFSGGGTQAGYKQAVASRDAAEDGLEQTRRAVTRQTRSAYRSVVAGISSVEARKQALVSAKSALEATQAGFEVGTRTIVDVLLSQQLLFSQEREYASSRHNFILSQLRLKQSAGTIDIDDLQAVNALLK
ncbi:type I secretion protein TolC [Ahniella affigens]|uniref:Type I secretion protein TolC n=1 Tax=Ahniella affigens TaxID=2021234 RepID=A0A2P1PT86_9GAMM|nr:TolC family outer membrane protein [Ahniella affigens]AVP98059.1 type I secretion protein TolC [Ahniella affigens]